MNEVVTTNQTGSTTPDLADPQLQAAVAKTLANPAGATPQKLLDLLTELAASSAKNHSVKDQRIAQLETQLQQLNAAQHLNTTLQQIDAALAAALNQEAAITELEQHIKNSVNLRLTLLDLTAKHTATSFTLGEAEKALIAKAHRTQQACSGTASSGEPLLVAAASRTTVKNNAVKGEELLGAVLLQTANHTHLEQQVVTHTAKALATFLTTQRRLLGDLAARRQELLELLVEPPAGGLMPSTLTRLAACGIIQNQAFRIMVAKGAQSALDALDNRLEFEYGSHLLRGVVEDTLIIVLNEQNFQQLKHLLQSNTQKLLIGHSPRLHRLEIVPPELALIRKVVTAALNNRRADSTRLVSLASYGVLGAFLSRVNLEPTLAAARETLAPLLDYDRTQQAQLTQTAFHFFNEGRNIKQVAAQLHIHPNTVRQRIDRIEQLLGANWSYGQAGLDHHIMLALLQLLDD